jgi:hypothetical protein
MITGEEGHQDGAVEGVRVHPLLVLRIPDARARPATHDRWTLVRCQDPQQQGGTGLSVSLHTFNFRLGKCQHFFKVQKILLAKLCKHICSGTVTCKQLKFNFASFNFISQGPDLSPDR